MSEPIIIIKGLNKVFPKTTTQKRVDVLQDIHLTVHRGEFLVLLGPSGCGKSTLLRIVAGLAECSSGNIEYGKSFNQKNVSFVFQNFGLLPWLSVFDNVALGLVARGVSEDERVRDTDTILKKFGLDAFKKNFPHELSGGMKQRVGLARAFVTKPDIIFLDEPFSELDFFTARSLREVLLDMWHQHNTTVVMVSHYIDEAVTLADRVAIFSDRPGTIVKVIQNDLSRPRQNRTDEFFAREDEILACFEERKN